MSVITRIGRPTDVAHERRGMSAIGSDLTRNERGWVFAGRCPDCCGLLTQRPPDGVAVTIDGVIDGVMETAITCQCGFGVGMKTDYKTAVKIRAIGERHDR